MHELLICTAPAGRVSGGAGRTVPQSVRLSRDVQNRQRRGGTACRADRFVPLMTEVPLANPTGSAVGPLSPSFGHVRQ